MVVCAVCTLLVVADCVRCPCCGSRQPRRKKRVIDLTGTSSAKLTPSQKSKRKRKRTYSIKKQRKKTGERPKAKKHKSVIEIE